MKKGLVLGEVFYPEDFIINDLVQEWHQMGLKLEVLTRAPSYPFGKIYSGYKNKIYQHTDFQGVKVHRFPFIAGYQKSVVLKLLNYLSFLFFSTTIILFIGKRYDKIFIYQTGPLSVAVAAIIAKKIYKTKVTIWTQDLWPDTVYAYGFKQTKLLKYFLDGLVKFIYKNCDTVLVSCEGFADRLRAYVPHKEIHYVPNWPLINGATKNRIVLPGKFNFTFTGNIGKVQNLENVILGFGLFSKNYPDACLNIVGDGSNLADLKVLVATHHIKKVNFTGRRPLGEMPAFFKASDVLIISLVDEPIYSITVPSKFQTYLTAAKPIFAVMKGEVVNMVEKYKIGVAALPSDPAHIGLGFERLYTMDAAESNDMSANAAHLLQKHFLKTTVIKKLTNFFWRGVHSQRKMVLPMHVS